jgi:Zn-dependent peptidase ImmA (M78 family)
MALALGLPVSFFARKEASSALALDHCHFRSLRSTSQKERRQVLAHAVILDNLINKLEEKYVDFPDVDLIKVSHQLKNVDEIEKFAIEARKHWGLGLGPIPNLFQLLESKGFIISYIPHQSQDVDAFSFWKSSRPFIYLVSTKDSTSRTRFDCSHELGHLLMHEDVLPGNKELEAQANRFAGAFLVPREVFIHESPRRLNWEHFYELKRRWRVSVAALIRRAYDLECLSEASYRRAFMQLNQSGERQKERDEPPPEKLTTLSESLKIAYEEITEAELTKYLAFPVEELHRLVSSGNTDVA